VVKDWRAGVLPSVREVNSSGAFGSAAGALLPLVLEVRGLDSCGMSAVGCTAEESIGSGLAAANTDCFSGCAARVEFFSGFERYCAAVHAGVAGLLLMGTCPENAGPVSAADALKAVAGMLLGEAGGFEDLIEAGVGSNAGRWVATGNCVDATRLSV
jgi:hypothetical protein